MTFVNAGLLIIVLIVVVNLWERMSQLSEEVQKLQQLMIAHKARQNSVASKVTVSGAHVEKPKTKRRYKVPATGKQHSAIRLVMKGGSPRGDEEIDRLRQNPDEVPGPKRRSGGFRKVGGPEGR